MAELVIRTPGEPERVVLVLDRPMVLGRHDRCDVQIVEVRASKRHLEIAPATVPGAAAGTAFVVTDLDSSNGTLVGEARIKRRVIVSGDVIRVGDTTMELRGTAAPGAAAAPARPAVVLSAGVAAPAAAVVPAPVVVSAAAGAPAAPVTDEPAAWTPEDARPSARESARMIRSGVLVLAVGIAAIVAAQMLAGGEAEKRRAAREEAEAFTHLLADRDRPTDLFVAAADDFLVRWPQSRRWGDVERLRDAHKVLQGRAKAADQELDALFKAGVQDDSFLIGRLHELKARAADDPGFSRRVDDRLQEVAKRRDDATTKDRLAAELEADKRLAQGDASGALRRLLGFLASHPGRTEEQSEAVKAKQAAIQDAANQLADQAIARAGATVDPDTKRKALFTALRGVAETPAGDRLRAEIAKVTGGHVPTAPPGVSGRPRPQPPTERPTAGPTAKPTATPEQLARAAEAEKAARDRGFATARAAFEALAKEEAGPVERKDWAARAADLARVQTLFTDFASQVAAAGDKPLRAKLSGGVFDVLGADDQGVRLRRGDKDATQAWTTMSPADTVTLLATGPYSPDKRLALGVLASVLDDRKTAVEQLVPLFEVESHRAAAFDVIARRLEGRTSVPEGGYKPFDGDVVDVAEFAKRTEAKHVAAVKAEAQAILEKAALDPVAKRLSGLRGLRDELDKRRAYALMAIFDTKHWPYPHPQSIAGPYNAVWTEIQKRTKAVEEIWNNPMTVKFPPTTNGGVAAMAARFEQIVKELEAKRVDVSGMREAMAPHVLYAGETSLNIRSFYRDAEERELTAYNRWVFNVHNPSRTAVISDAEREQVRITNEYRDMMGYMLDVEPGPEPIEAIDGSNVVKILDKGREKSRTRLHLVRIDDRLVSSARGHSMDMDKRNFFDHTAPANAATGQGPTSPFDRMRLAGYSGGSASENIARAGNALTAHQEWLYSSGHHRNILSDWADMGAGALGSFWTQNFGSGGGADWTIPGRGGSTTDGDK